MMSERERERHTQTERESGVQAAEERLSNIFV